MKRIAKGRWNAKIAWSFWDTDGDGVGDHLVIEGEGSMYDKQPKKNPFIKFRECIRTVEIREGITETGLDTFSYCDALHTAILPNSLTSLGQGTFVACVKLGNIKLPDNLVNIGPWCFGKCTSITQLRLPQSVCTIGMYAFLECINIKKINIPAGVTRLEKGVFGGCRRLTLINLPEALEVVDKEAFAACESLPDQRFPVTLSVIAERAFVGCVSMKRVDIPENVTAIGKSAFCDCFGLTKLVLPENLEKIGAEAFAHCKYLPEVTIPRYVNEIGAEAFADCRNLTEINVDEANTSFCSIDGVLYNQDKTELLCYPAGKLGDRYVIPPTVVRIAPRAFQRSYLKYVYIPDSVRSIATYAFRHCSKLMRLYIPHGVTTLGYGIMFHGNPDAVLYTEGHYYVGKDVSAFWNSIDTDHTHRFVVRSNYSRQRFEEEAAAALAAEI